MEIKPTYHNCEMEDYSNAHDKSNHKIKNFLERILATSAELLESDIPFRNNSNTFYLSVGDSATELNFDLVQNEIVSLFLCRSYFSHTSMPITDLEYLHSVLAPNGRIIVQEINFSEINCFPFNFAIGRFNNLYKEFCTASGFSYNIGTSLTVKLVEVGFSEIERSYLPPIFLKASNRNLINYLFEYISDFVLENNLIIEEEKIALSAEISNYLKNENNMISLPGVYQIKAKK